MKSCLFTVFFQKLADSFDVEALKALDRNKRHIESQEVLQGGNTPNV